MRDVCQMLISQHREPKLDYSAPQQHKSKSKAKLEQEEHEQQQVWISKYSYLIYDFLAID